MELNILQEGLTVASIARDVVV